MSDFGAHTLQYIWPSSQTYLYRCICSNRGRLGFHAKIQIIFGTVLNTAVVQVVFPECEHGGGRGQEHLQTAGQGRGLAALMNKFLTNYVHYL